MQIKTLLEKNKWMVSAFVVLGSLTLLQSLRPGPTAQPEKPLVESVDTLIPRGHILVPLELENLDHVSSLIGDSGVVDLYVSPGDGKKRKLVASRVKIIQAPFNPQVYAALIREAEGFTIQNHLGPFRAVVQNPGAVGAHVKSEQKNNLSIKYQR